MKHTIRIFTIAVFLLITPLLIFSQPLPDDPGPGTEVGGPPAGAPVGNGTFILITLAAAYAFRKVYVNRTQTAEE